MYKKDVVITDDSTDPYECYTDGSYWNGWANILFTAEQLTAWLADSPYDFRIMDNGVIIYFEDDDFIPVVHFEDEQGNSLVGYDMNGYCFMYLKDYNE